jgi:2-polyprenyl-6-methoxyphenol hydroxylase-like FAD-dependent oxidoreductase
LIKSVVKKPKPITIAGGGLAGLTLGIGLRQRQVPVTIVEAGRYPRHRVCGEFICGLGNSVLAKLRLDEILGRCGAIEATTALFQGESVASPVRRLPTRAVCLSRFVLDAELSREFERLGGRLEQNQRRREADFGEGVVRATGRRLKTKEKDWRWIGLKFHARNVNLVADLEMYLGRNGYVGVCRLPDNEVNVCGLFRRPAGNGSLTGDPKTFLLGANRHLRHRLEGAEILEDTFCSVAGLSLEPATARPEECCVGDALTMIPPVTGNGMSMAFESAGLALDPLLAYSEGTISWIQVRENIARRYATAFTGRLRWAGWLHRFLFSRIFGVLGPPALRSELVWRTLFRHTR